LCESIAETPERAYRKSSNMPGKGQTVHVPASTNFGDLPVHQNPFENSWSRA
jgi:hypothetical protein